LTERFQEFPNSVLVTVVVFAWERTRRLGRGCRSTPRVGRGFASFRRRFCQDLKQDRDPEENEDKQLIEMRRS